MNDKKQAILILLILIIIFSLIGGGFFFFSDLKEKFFIKKPDFNVILIGWSGVKYSTLHDLLNNGRLNNLESLMDNGGQLIPLEVGPFAGMDDKSGWAEILTGYDRNTTNVFNNKDYKPIPKGYTIFEQIKNYFKNNISVIFLSSYYQELGFRGPHKICDNCLDEETWWNEEYFQRSPTVNNEKLHVVDRDGDPYYNATSSIDLLKNRLGINDKVATSAILQIERLKNKKFFMFIQFEEPDKQGHEYDSDSDQYYNALESNDKYLGKIIEQLKKDGIYDQTLIYVTTDHSFNVGRGSKKHNKAPHTFLITNNKRVMKNSGDRLDITPTVLHDYGIKINNINPLMNGSSLFVK